MYAVIFSAEIASLDSEYSETAARMREIAMLEYGCTGFTSTTEGDKEIAVSYWPSLDAICAWKTNPDHLKAQELGRTKWYKSYKVQVVEVLREYGA